MLVRDMLELPSFTGAQIIAGISGATGGITSAMVLEGADIENWGKKGQLIITSYFALEHMSTQEIERFFRTMSLIGISAFAFKPGRLLDEIPTHIIDLCNDFDLPLIRLAPTVKYEQILMDVLGHVLDSNLTLLNRFYEVHRHLMALALRQPSIPAILNTIKNSLHVDLTYLDTAHDRRLGTNQSKAIFSGYSLHRIDPNPYQTHSYFEASLHHENSNDEEKAIAIRIPSSDGIDYYLIVHNEGRKLSQLDTMTVENIVSLLQMEILKQNAIRQKMFYQNNNTVHDLLLDRFSTHERIDSALSSLGIDQHPFYEVLLIRVTFPDPADIDRQDELQQAIRRKLRGCYPDMVYYVNGERLLFLHNFRSTLSGIDINRIRELIDELHESSDLPIFSHLAVLSSSADRYSLSKINNEVISVYRIFGKPDKKNITLRYENLGIYKLLLNANDPSHLSSFIDPRLQRMNSENPELLHTLVLLCENGLSCPRTAELLYVHPKTVRYRIDRARAHYGIDLKNSDDFMQVVLSDRIFTLIEGE